MTRKMNLREPGPPLAPADIDSFEEEIGGRLPEDYKRFLLTFNGGWNEPPLALHWNDRLNMVPDFRELLPTDEIGLRRALRNLRELNVDGYLPVSSTRNGEDICLSFIDKIGSVWLVVYSYENDVPVRAKLVPLAKSFNEFLDGLVEMPEPYCRIEELGKKGAGADLERYLAEGHSIDATGKNGNTIICEAIMYGNVAMVEACLERGAGLSQTIQMAVGNDRLELVKRLVEAGADVNEQNEYGRRPLNYVPGIALPGEEGSRNLAMRDLLISLGAK